MRRPKFRGYSTIFNEWLYGDLVVADNGTVCILPENSMEMDGHHIRQVDDRPLYVDPESVGQYTGIKYQGMGEIYEGDILHIFPYEDEEWAEYNTIVECINGNFEVFDGHEYVDWDYCVLSYFLNSLDDGDFEIIGNKYQNHGEIQTEPTIR